jgi:hypothetical protein
MKAYDISFTYNSLGNQTLSQYFCITATSQVFFGVLIKTRKRLSTAFSGVGGKMADLGTQLVPERGSQIDTPPVRRSSKLEQSESLG